MEDNKLLES